MNEKESDYRRASQNITSNEKMRKSNFNIKTEVNISDVMNMSPSSSKLFVDGINGSHQKQ
jgi:hypothetical protein